MAMEEWGDVMLAFLDQLGIGEFDVFGYHTGSVAAIDLAVRASGRVRHVAVISLPLMERAAREQHLAGMAPDLQVAVDGSHLTAVWQKKWPYRGGTQSLALFDTFMSEYVRPGPFNYWAYRALFGYPLESRLADVSQPVLVFNPQDEISDNTRRAMPLLRNGQLVDVAPWGYGMLDTNAEEIAARLRAHFDS
jgi:pimeloyl-ACP methyl ester carboxylesterase